MIVKKKNKRDPQRLQHSVRFDIEFYTKNKEDDPSKLIIDFVQAGSISDKKFFIGDLIKSVNETKVINKIDLDNEINKVNDTKFLISFSYGRALQQSALKTWSKNMKDAKKVHNVFNHRAKMNGLSSKAEWSKNLEKEFAA